ncbi:MULTISPECIES: efflux RND transporter periplasmic adaptor subunit [unclassified Neptuniibacter]|uniref:efflux RND transporter periplasmic adaptor subunit n=1 Tax=unclassified Neptuniibacter TaxID=2630693 RepID=UPI0025DA60AC|nr:MULTISPECIES: efflux RND transporter periplasmic adaptor subunit [unclassified Neptuniibacter]|tara:strand:- start:16344 stop:17882 length:1539 start_codon:yes stop_codon:yes gene_type:complete
MKKSSVNTLLISLVLLIGAVAGFYLAKSDLISTAETVAEDSDKPLYWVAPMDANYRRDQPGLSPMGMELVPVYAEDSSSDSSPGTITISPEVVNNLGVRIAPVLFSPLQNQIETVGYISFDQEKVIDIHSRISGWVETLAVNAEGEYVEKGALLYEIYSPELANAQEEFIAALKSGNRYLRSASQSKLQALGVQQGFIERLKGIKKVVQNVPVFAEKAGYVKELNIRQGMYIKPATKLISMGPLDQVWVTAEFFERQAHQVNVGDVAEMTLDYLPGSVWQGKVDYIYPALDKTTRTLQVRLRFDNPELLLKPDMFARLSVSTQPSKPMLNIPTSALISTGSQKRVVLSLGDGRYKSVAVTVGKSTGTGSADRTAILTGIYPEDWVVTSAQFLLDSESSISSDFMRMTPPMMGVVEEVWVAAMVMEVDVDKRLVTLSHEAIREWQQSAMLMEIPVSEGVDINKLSQGDVIQVLLNGGNMSNLVVADYILPRPKAPRANTPQLNPFQESREGQL